MYQTPEEFVQTSAHYLAAQPGIEVLGLGDLTLHLRVNGMDITSDISAFYGLYSDAPDQLLAVLQTLLESLIDTSPDRREANPAVLVKRVMPMLKPLALLDEVRRRHLPTLIYRPLAGDIMTTYVVDEGQSVVYLNQDHAARWGVDEATLYDRALKNLRRKPWRPEPGVLGRGREAILIFNGGDGFDATRLLLPELFAPFAASLPGNLVIGVPSRDFLIAFSDADERIVQRVKAQIENDVRVQPYPLTEHLFTLRDGQLYPYPASAVD